MISVVRYVAVLAILLEADKGDCSRVISSAHSKRRITDATYYNQCQHKPNGRYALAYSSMYLQCSEGVATYKQCDSHATFVPSCGECLVQLPSQMEFFCEGRISKTTKKKKIKYEHPWTCKGWIVCTDGKPKEHFCPDENTFDSKMQKCIKSSIQCNSAPITAPHTYAPFNPSEMPDHIDAAFLWHGDLVLIEAAKYYIFDSNNGQILREFVLQAKTTRSIATQLHVDAALSFPGKRMYFFQRNKFWQWGFEACKRKISKEWNGIPDNLDSAFYWPYKRKAYFFKGKYFYRYDMERKQVDDGYPKEISLGWPGATPGINAAVSLRNRTVFLFNGRKHFTFNPPVCKSRTV